MPDELPSALIAESPALDSENPWPGLFPFQEADESYFQGRENEKQDLLRLVMRERVTVLYGLSGLGKSSLLMAGLFPLLRPERVFPVYVRLDFQEQKPLLAAQVHKEIAAAAPSAQIEVPQVEENQTLWEYFHRANAEFWDDRDRPVVPLLVFDQFEEIFTLGRRDRDSAEAAEKFIDELADLAEGRPPTALKLHLDQHPEQTRLFQFRRHNYKLLMAVREDFLPDLETLRTRIRAVALNRFRLRRMNGVAAVQAVSQARDLIDGDVAELVVRRVSGTRTNPPLEDLEIDPALLSFVCRELNFKRQQLHHPKISASLLDDNYTTVIKEYYEGSFTGLPGGVRTYIENRLLTFSGFRDSVALEDALRVPDITREAIDKLVKRRLLRIEERSGALRLELSHDLLTTVIKQSRDERLALETEERERKARLEAEERERIARVEGEERGRKARLEAEERARLAQKALRKSRAVALLFIVLTLAAGALAAFGLFERAQENKAEVRSEVSEAELLLSTGKHNEVLARLARALRLVPDSQAARSWMFDLLLHDTYSRAVVWHQGEVVAAAFSPDGAWVVTASNDKTARVWEASTGKPVGQPMTHKGRIISASFSPDGKLVVTASEDTTAQVWDAANGNPVAQPMKHDDQVTSASFSHNGQWVVTTSADDTARVWEARTARPVGQPMVHDRAVSGHVENSWVYSAAFSPGDNLIVTGSGGSAQVWAWHPGPGSWSAQGRPLSHQGAVKTVIFSPDGRHVLSASDDGFVRVWNASDGRPAGRPLQHNDRVTAAAFSPNGNWVVTASEDNSTQVWDWATGKRIGDALENNDVVDSARFSPDGRRVLTASRDHTAQVWDAATGKSIGQPFRHEAEVHSAEFSSDGKWVVTASADKTARIWAAESRPAAPEPLPHGGLVKFAAFSPDGTRLVTASDDGTSRVWDAASGKPLGQPLRHGGEVTSAVFSPNGDRVVTASNNIKAKVWEARVWEAATGKPVGQPLSHKRFVASANFSPDSKWVVTASYDGTAQVWEADTGKAVGSALQHGSDVATAAFSPDGKWIVTASYDGSARMWKAATGTPGPVLHHAAAVNSAAFSPDGKSIVSASDDGTVVLWDAARGKLLHSMAHDSRVVSAVFSPDGRRVLSASDDHTARLWEAATGMGVGQPLTHDDQVRLAVFSTDGTLALTASTDKTRIWAADTGKAVGQPREHGHTVYAAAFSPNGRWMVTASGNEGQLWEVMAGSWHDSDLLANAAEVISGYQINDLGSLVPFVPGRGQSPDLDSLRARARTAKSALTQFLEWYSLEPWRRTLSPGLNLPR